MQKHTQKRLAGVAIAAIAAAGASLALAAPASAKTATCTTTIQVKTYDGTTVLVPGYASGFDGASVVYSDNCLLAKGDKGEAVKALQRGLSYMATSVIVRVDGDYGKITKQAITDIQSEYRLKVDGVYGPQTRDKICWPIAGSKTQSCTFLVIP